jgi:hypothetical protein
MIRTLILGTCLVLAAQAAHAADVAALTADSRAAVKAFAQSLKAALTAAIEEGGPIRAIGVCNTKAPEIAQRESAAFGGRVGRTSLKRRNPANAPDAWERDVLNAFEARKAAGEDVAKLEHVEVVEENGRQVFRYMKAIPTGGICVTCHGADLDPELAATLDALYPTDQARGFAIGDIRGAFTIRKALD